MKSKTKQVVKALLIVLALFFLLFFSFYVFFEETSKNTDFKNQDLLDVDFASGNNIELKNTLPISDKLGKEFDGKGVSEGIIGYTEFSIKNIDSSAVNYEVYLTKDVVETSELSERYVKLYLTDDNNNALEGFNKNRIPDFSSLSVQSDNPSGFILFKSYIEAFESEKFRLRVWLSDTYAINNNEESFKFHINIKAV